MKAHSPQNNTANKIPPGDPIGNNTNERNPLTKEQSSIIYRIYTDAKQYDIWYSKLSKKAQREEYEWLMLDGNDKKIERTPFQVMIEKAQRIRMAWKIEKLKKEGKLDERYKLK